MNETLDNGTEGTLTYAVESADLIRSSSPAIILLGALNYTWDPATDWAAGTAPATLDLSSPTDLIIQGAGAGQTIIDASNLDNQIFNVDPGASLTLDGITLENGTTTSLGGGIDNAGALTINDSAIEDNRAGIGGGGIDNTGALTLSNSLMSDDTSGGGGGIYNSGSLTISGSTIQDCVAAGYAGAIFSGGKGSLTLDNSVLTGDSVTSGGSDSGGAINYDSTGLLDIEDSTLSNDHVVGGGGGSSEGGALYVNANLVTLLNDTFSDDSAQGGTGVTGASGSTTAAGGSGGKGGDGDGGGLYVFYAFALTLTNCTFEGDIAQGGTGGAGGTVAGAGGAGGNGDGGAVYLIQEQLVVTENEPEPYVLYNNTLVGNSAHAGAGGTGGAGSPDGAGGGNGTNSSGGGLYDLSPITLVNTLIALNSATTSGPDVFGSINSYDHNLIGDGDGSNLSNGDAGRDLVGYTAAQLDLGPLTNNGGRRPRPWRSCPVAPPSLTATSIPGMVSCPPQTGAALLGPLTDRWTLGPSNISMTWTLQDPCPSPSPRILRIFTQ